MNIINDISDIKWKSKSQPIIEKNLWLIEKQIPFNLPKQFIDLLKISDGGRVDYEFEYFDIGCGVVFGDSICVIYGFQEDESKFDLINSYYNQPEFFPKNLLSFSSSPGDNLICFDYRKDQKTDNPPVVFWNSEFPEEDAISFLAEDFMGFLKMLRDPEPEPEIIEKYFKKSEDK